MMPASHPIEHFVAMAVTYGINAAWQVPLVSAAAWLASRALARTGAGTVHRVWVGALLVATLLPGVRLTDWSMRCSAFGHTAASGSGSVRVTTMPGAVGLSGAVHWAPWLINLLFAAYAASTMYAAARLGCALLRVRQCRRAAVPLQPAGDLQQSWAALRTRMPGPDVQLAESCSATGPMVLGIRHPLLLVPQHFFASVARQDRDAALAHELAHVSRRDFAKNLAYSVLTLPIAWHPCAWLLRRCVSESREMVCDEMAASAVGGRREYARSLLRLASAVPAALSSSSLPAMGIMDGNTLERRVTTMLDTRKKLQGAARWAAMGAVALLTVGASASTMAMHMDVMVASGTAAKTPKPVQVKGSVMEGNVLSRVSPIYPPEAKKKHEEGTVSLAATINKLGAIIDLRVARSAGRALDQSALDAVRHWRYKPYLLNGDPVEVQTTINVTYSLGK